MYESKLEFPGGMGDAKQKTFFGGGGEYEYFLELHNVQKGKVVLGSQTAETDSRKQLQVLLLPPPFLPPGKNVSFITGLLPALS